MEEIQERAKAETEPYLLEEVIGYEILDEAKLWDNPHLKGIFYETLKHFREGFYDGLAEVYKDVDENLDRILYNGIRNYVKNSIGNNPVVRGRTGMFYLNLLVNSEKTSKPYKRSISRHCKNIVEETRPSDIEPHWVDSYGPN